MHAAGPDPWPGGCECGGGDTKNALAAHDVEAADLLGTGPCPATACRAAAARSWSQPGRPVPDMKAVFGGDSRHRPRAEERRRARGLVYVLNTGEPSLAGFRLGGW